MAILNYNDVDRQAIEAIRTLKSNILFSSIDKPIKSVLVTSCGAGAGKSTISILLALAMTESGRRVLIVDTDLRKPTVGNYLGMRSERGLVHYLLGQEKLEKVITSSLYDNLYFIDSGVIPPNPVEMVGSQQFAGMMQAVYEQFDFVIYDSAPLGLFIESALVAGRVDGTVLVIDSGEVDYRAAQDVVTQLEKAQAKVLGVVLNKADQQSSHYDSGYYKYYHEEGKKKRKR